MATTPLRPDSVRANPEPASSDSFRHSRRAALGTIAGVPLAATFGTIALPAMAASNGWRVALNAYRQAKKTSETYERDHYNPARKAWRARVDAVPPVVIPYTDAIGAAHEMRSDHDWSVWRAQQVVSGRRKDEPKHIADMCRQFIHEISARDDRIAACSKPFDPIYDESERLDEIAGEACDCVINYPVSTVAELVEKIDFIEALDIPNDETIFPAITSDIRRLAAGGR